MSGNSTTIQPQTLGQIARSLGERYDRLEYVVQSRGIPEAGRINNWRLFDARAVSEIRSALDHINSRRRKVAVTT